MTIGEAYRLLYSITLSAYALLLFVPLYRAIRGPRITDRILAVNMMGTILVSSIAILAVMLKEGYLVDVSLIYSLVSFLSVLVFASVYIRKRAADPGDKGNLAAHPSGTASPTEDPEEGRNA